MAAVYEVSQRTVRRYCQPCDYDPASRRALYDVLAAEDVLEGVIARPDATVEARAVRRRRLEAARYVGGGRS
jgi:hypothetical protein